MPLESVDTSKPQRTLENINQEYTALCAQAGQKQYQIQCAQDDLKALNLSIRKINMEAAKAKQYEDAQAASPANLAPVSEGEPSDA